MKTTTKDGWDFPAGMAVVFDTDGVELPQVFDTWKDATEQAHELNVDRGPAGRFVVCEFDQAKEGDDRATGRCDVCRRLTTQPPGAVCGFPTAGLPAGETCPGKVAPLHGEVAHLERAIGDLIARVWRLAPELREVVLGDPEPGEPFSRSAARPERVFVPFSPDGVMFVPHSGSAEDAASQAGAVSAHWNAEDFRVESYRREARDDAAA